MSETLLEAPKGSPEWAKKVVLWLGIPTAILLAFLALADALGNTGGHLKGWCQAIGACPPPKRPTLQLPDHVSGWIDGRTTSGQAVCNSVRQAYQQQHPDYTISMQVMDREEERRTVWRGLDPTHAQYRYHCKFWGEPKG
jgi:hypothetical protein